MTIQYVLWQTKKVRHMMNVIFIIPFCFCFCFCFATLGVIFFQYFLLWQLMTLMIISFSRSNLLIIIFGGHQFAFGRFFPNVEVHWKCCAWFSSILDCKEMTWSMHVTPRQSSAKMLLFYLASPWKYCLFRTRIWGNSCIINEGTNICIHNRYQIQDLFLKLYDGQCPNV
jgi:hypothetical protein